jgi:ribosomal protein S18 acetylase RimI-like enzyme
LLGGISRPNDDDERQSPKSTRSAAGVVQACAVTEWAVTGFASLSDVERARVDDLRRACESVEPLDLKLELDEADATGEPIHFLAEANGELVGYAGLTPGDEAEACGMVLPASRGRGVGTQLLNHVLGAGRRLGRESVLFIGEDSGPVALAWLRRIGAADDSAEQRMTVSLDAGVGGSETTPGDDGAPLELRPATDSDRDVLAVLLGDGFAPDPEKVTDRLESTRPEDFLLGLDAGEVVGTLRLTETSRRTMIYGFVVDRERRGQRLGTRMLAAVFALLRSRGVTEVGLEVDPENTPAVRLYTAFGFAVVTTYRYMRLASSLGPD